MIRSILSLFGISKKPAAVRRSPGKKATMLLEALEGRQLMSVNPITDNLGIVRNGPDWHLDGAGNGGAAEQTRAFGLPGDQFLAGDWNGDGKDDLIAVRANAQGGLSWYVDLNGDNQVDVTHAFGLKGDKPVVGDWDGDGKADPGVVRDNKSSGLLNWYLDATHAEYANPAPREFGLVTSKDTPLVGDWNGDGKTDLGVTRANNAGKKMDWLLETTGDKWADQSFTLGSNKVRPVAGDWLGTGKDQVGFVEFDSSMGLLAWSLDTNGDRVADQTRHFGFENDQLVTGNWNSAGVRYQLSGGSLYRYVDGQMRDGNNGAGPLTFNAKSFQVAPTGEVYALINDGQLYRFVDGLPLNGDRGFGNIAEGVESFSLGADKTVYATLTRRVLLSIQDGKVISSVPIPEQSAPGTGNPGTGNPGNPGAGNPVTGNPGNGTPGAGNPGTNDPTIGIPEGGTPKDPGNGTGSPSLPPPENHNPGTVTPGKLVTSNKGTVISSSTITTSAGTFVLKLVQTHGAAGNNLRLYGDVIYSTGTSSQRDISIGDHTRYGNQTMPVWAKMTNGNIAIAWLKKGANANTIRYAIMDPRGRSVGADDRQASINLNFSITQPSIVSDSKTGGFIISWQEQGKPSTFSRSFNLVGVATSGVIPKATSSSARVFLR